MPSSAPPGAVEAMIRTLTEMQAQTASLHKQYLDTVAQAHESIQRLSPLLGQGHSAAQTADTTPFEMHGTAASQPNEPTPTATWSGGTTDSPQSPTPTAGDPSLATPAAPPAPAAPEIAPPRASNTAESTVLAIVAEKTGYPVEMLSPDMELDADLGIDSIKRVEILAALQDAVPELPEPAPDHLSTLVTLGDVAALIETHAPGQRSAPPDANRSEPLGTSFEADSNTGTASISTAGSQPDSDLTDVLLAVVAEKTGYPSEMLDLSMQLDADLGIDSIKRVEILAALEPHLPGAESPDAQAIAELISLGDIAALLSGSAGDANPPVVIGATGSSGKASADEPDEDLTGLLLRVVAEKTGYPPEVLDLGMQLDADLGIDSIKRVEILAALEEELGVPAPADPEALATLDTLSAVLTLLENSSQSPSPSVPSPPPDDHEQNPPAPGLNIPSLEVQTPIAQALPPGERTLLTLGTNAEFVIVDDDETFGGHVTAALAVHGIAARVVPWAGADDVQPTANTAGVLLASPTAGHPLSSRLLVQATGLLGRFSKVLRASSERDHVVGALTCLGGEFGLGNGDTKSHPGSASFSGLIKSLASEWPEVSCKVIDRSTSTNDPVGLACDIVDELLLCGPLEVGLSENRRVALTLAPQPRPASSPPAQAPTVDEGSRPLVVFSGGARGITASLALAMAERSPYMPVLLGRTALDVEEPPWLSDSQDEASIKRALSKHADFSTPAALSRAAKEILTRREVRQTLAAFEAKGLPVLYRAVDVQDTATLAETLRMLIAEFGPIRGLAHGAGVIADRRIEDKAPEDIASVYNTKVHAFETLCDAIEESPDWVAVFSSSSARFGRRGQSDYAAANEVLNKQAQALKLRFPATRVVSFNWGPWAGGMVTPELARLFASEGIGLIELSSGVELAADILLAEHTPETPVELVITATARDKADVSSAAAATPTAPEPSSDPPLLAAHKHEVSFRAIPMLSSHVLGGQGVLPLVMSTEWLIQAAMHNNPGLVFHGFDNLRVLSPVKVASEEAVVLTSAAGIGTHYTQSFDVASALSGERLTASANVILSPTASAPPYSADGPSTTSGSLPQRWVTQELYGGEVLFHGPALQAITSLESMSQSGISALVDTTPSPSEWLSQPWRSSWITDPLALDAGFQLLVIWCLEYLGAHSLPTSVASYRQFARRFPEEGVRIEAHIVTVSTHRVLANLSFWTLDGERIADMQGYECVVDPTLSSAFANNTLAPAAMSAAGDD